MLTIFNKNSSFNRCNSRKGITLVEILVVSTVIAVMASVAFPVYKIFQQREKEKRLKRILLEVRSAIAGSKSQQSNKIWEEGHRNYVYRVGMQKIWELHKDDAEKLREAEKKFVDNGTQNGLFFPRTPSYITFNQPYKIIIATGSLVGEEIEIEIQQKFLRHIPPHPFKNWYPNARWEFKPAVNSAAGGPTYASSPADPWNSNLASGVLDIVSRGAGLALDGSSTDDW